MQAHACTLTPAKYQRRGPPARCRHHPAPDCCLVSVGARASTWMNSEDDRQKQQISARNHTCASWRAQHFLNVHLQVRCKRHLLRLTSAAPPGKKKFLPTARGSGVRAPCLSIRKSSPNSWPMCVPASHPLVQAHHSQRIQRPPWFLCQRASAPRLPTPPATLLFCPASPLAPAQGLCPETSCTAYGLSAEGSAPCGLLTAPPFPGANRREGHRAKEKEGGAQDVGHRCELSGQ